MIIFTSQQVLGRLMLLNNQAKDLVSVDNPNVDYITAESEDGRVLFVVLLNNQAKENNLNMIVRSSQLASDKEMKDYTKLVKLNAFGYKIIKIKL